MPSRSVRLPAIAVQLWSETLVSTINYGSGQTRTNNAVAALASDGSGGLEVVTESAGSVHFILDVNGYFDSALPHEVRRTSGE